MTHFGRKTKGREFYLRGMQRSQPWEIHNRIMESPNHFVGAQFEALNQNEYAAVHIYF